MTNIDFEIMPYLNNVQTVFKYEISKCFAEIVDNL